MIICEVHLPSAPPNNLANERKSLKFNHFKDFSYMPVKTLSKTCGCPLSGHVETLLFP